MIHYFESIRSRGSADGYNTEWSERLHIDFAKEGYRASNQRDFVPQMTKWLDRREAMARFRQYLDWLLRRDELQDADGEEEDEEADGKADRGSASHGDDDNEQTTSNTDLPASHHLAVKPGFPHVKLEGIVTRFHAPDFLPALTKFIRRAHPPPQQPILPNTTDLFNIYKRVSIRLRDIAAVGRVGFLQRIRATPHTPGPRYDTAANFDTVLVRTESENGNQVTKGTYLEGLRVAQVRVIFALPDHLRHNRSLPKFLAYIEWFNPLRSPDPDSGLFSVTRSSHHGQPVAEVVPIGDIVSGCHLIPKFGTKFSPAKWTHLEILDNWKQFSLNKYIDLATFYEHQDLH